MRKRKTKSADDKMDDRTNAAFVYSCSGIPVPILRLKEIFAEGRRLQLAGASNADLCMGVKAIAQKISKEST